MNTDRGKQTRADARRRYLVHLSYVLKADAETFHYVVRIRPSAVRRGAFGQRDYNDDCELIAAINPVLPPGSDVRDVFGQIENPNGFFYVLWLSDKQAEQLGWDGNSLHPTSA